MISNARGEVEDAQIAVAIAKPNHLANMLKRITRRSRTAANK